MPWGGRPPSLQPGRGTHTGPASLDDPAGVQGQRGQKQGLGAAPSEECTMGRTLPEPLGTGEGHPGDR